MVSAALVVPSADLRINGKILQDLFVSVNQNKYIYLLIVFSSEYYLLSLIFFNI